MPGLTRRQIAQLVLLLLVVANAGLFAWTQLDRSSLGDQQRRLAQLERQPLTLRGGSNPVVLKSALAEVEQKIEEAGLAFPTRMDTVALQDHIIQAARWSLVQLTSFALQPAVTRALAGGSYPVVILTVRGRGDLPNLNSFLGQVERSVYNTSILENISITQAEEGWSIRFDVVLYAKPG